MTDLARGHAARPGSVIPSPANPSPASIHPRRATAADSGRATARAVLDDALSGVVLTASERRFLDRLSQWDKRNATTVAALVSRARQSGRPVPGLTPEQREIVLFALTDAIAYRTSGAASAGCWDCASRCSGLCAEHARDADRARGFADLAALLSGQVAGEALPCLGPVPDFRQEAAVAS